MNEPNPHAHPFNPSRKGTCKTIFASVICGKFKHAPGHERWREKHLETIGQAIDEHVQARLLAIENELDRIKRTLGMP